MADREPQPDCDRTLAVLHQLAGDVIDRRDMVGIDGMAQPERVGQRCRSEQQRIVAEAEIGPQPDRDIHQYQKRAEQV